MSLRKLVMIFALIAAIAPVATLLPVLASGAKGATEEYSGDLLQATGRQTANLLVRVLFAQWREVEGLARLAQASGVNATLRERIETIKAINDRYAWIGVATPDGKVVMASGGLLEGRDVAARPWFSAGLDAAFAGDLHQPLLLQKLIAPDATDPIRLLDFALPIRRADNSVLAVLGSYLEWPWVRDLVRSVPVPPRTEVLIVSRDGTVIIGPADLEGKKLEIRSAVAAGQGSEVITEETWPDNETYLSAVVPMGGYRGLPSFGWSVIVRQPSAVAYSSMRSVVSDLMAPLLALAGTLLLAGIAFAHVVGRPVAMLAAAAETIAAGNLDVPVPETGGYREAARIAGALSRVQGALARVEHGSSVSPADARQPGSVLKLLRKG